MAPPKRPWFRFYVEAFGEGKFTRSCGRDGCRRERED